MTPLFSRRLQLLGQAPHTECLRGIRRGIEKESLRVTPEGRLAPTPHPEALGAALTHPNITTDFAEALLEFITPACDTIEDALGWLEEIHTATGRVLQAQQEKLWVASMPCALDSDSAIPVAQYGNTHAARMKTIYRIGLGYRYGRLMQTIAGIHYNLSFPASFWALQQQDDGDRQAADTYRTQRYFGLIRNFRRHIWLLLYLFGASPAVCPTFVQGRPHRLQPLNERNTSLHLPYATCLRMGNLGYQSDAQRRLMVCYNGLSSYTSTLKRGLTESYPAYEAIGMRDDHGDYRQLSTSLLQIENEFYSTIRPKRVTRSGETPIVALHERGVEYIEVRCLDLNPYLPVGIDDVTARFVEAFLLWCALEDSPSTDEAEYHRIARNQLAVVERGRDPALQLEDGMALRALPEWALSFMDGIAACAALLDRAYGTTRYTASVVTQRRVLADSALTPSARLLQDMREGEQSFFRLACRLSEQHQARFVAREPSAEWQAYFARCAAESLQQRAGLEAAGSPLTFEQYLAQYYAQYEQVPG